MPKENPNKEKARTLANQIAAMSDEQKAAWMARVPVLTTEGKPISGKNHMLAAMQRDDATMVAGFRQWLALGRAVRKGETALYIFAPSGRKAEPSAPSGEKAGDALEAVGDSIRFLLVPVFDVAQTDPVETTQAVAA
ncbi:ArdC family protein [Bradyrhizobium sp. CAR08]